MMNLLLSHTDRAPWIISILMNVCLDARITEEYRVHQISLWDFRNLLFIYFFHFSVTAPHQTSRGVSLTGDKCLHSPPDILVFLWLSPLILYFSSRSKSNPLSLLELKEFWFESTVKNSFGVFSKLWMSKICLHRKDIIKGCVTSTHACTGCLFSEGPTLLNASWQKHPKSLWILRETFPNLYWDAVLLHFLPESLKACEPSTPRSARMAEVRRHARAASMRQKAHGIAWSHLIPPPICHLNSSLQGGWTRLGFNQGPFVCLEKRGSRRKETGARLREMKVSEADEGVPRMSRHWKRPAISPGDGSRVQFSSCALNVWVCSKLHI